LNNSFEEIIPFQKALKQFVSNIDSDYAKGNTEFFIGFEGSFGNKHTTPRTLTSRFLGNMVCLEGIVVRCKYTNIIVFLKKKEKSIFIF
jgi:DNA replication licensing factor MCM3